MADFIFLRINCYAFWDGEPLNFLRYRATFRDLDLIEGILGQSNMYGSKRCWL